MAQGWQLHQIPHLNGRTALVTGANSGLGLETARALGGAGADVVLACRDTGKGQAAAEAIRRDHPEAGLEVMALDLADLASVQTFAERFDSSRDRLDLVINNAGVMALPERRTADGFEMQLGTNHLGHFALTGRLMPKLLASPGARVVTLSSLAHKFGAIELDDLNWQRRRYRKWLAYGQSKLANLLFTLELQRRLDAAGAKVISVGAHPGYAATHLQFAGPQMSGSRAATLGMQLANGVLAQSQADGALPGLYAATGADIAGGDFCGPEGIGEFRGAAVKVEPAGRAQKRETAEALWQESVALTGVDYPL